jgi:hypothetical protein
MGLMCYTVGQKGEKNMQDFPMFTTEYGVASLFLREIPYRGRAHIKIQSSQDPEKLLEECVSFCRVCGAEWIDAAGDSVPPYSERIRDVWQEKESNLFFLSEHDPDFSEHG